MAKKQRNQGGSRSRSDDRVEKGRTQGGNRVRDGARPADGTGGAAARPDTPESELWDESVEEGNPT